MKRVTIFHLALGLLIILFFALPRQSFAQDSGSLESSEKYSREELAQMLAPVALYPDALLSQVLMASTYPIEVIEADRWVKSNPQLTGEALDDALMAEDWDPSVKAICHFPSILALMSERITETTNLGNAFLAQEAEVMDIVQELRAKAHAQGNLATTPQQKVIVEKETIIIEPADPRVIYVPYYDPFHIYGPWWYPAYPPYFWGPSSVRIGLGISYWPGFYFGFAFGTWSYFDWHRHHIFIDVHRRPRYVRHDRWIARPGPWHHAPTHRRGVAYRDKVTARKYGQYPRRVREITRDTRGFERTDRDRDRDRRIDDRTRIDRERREDDRARISPDRQERERAERDKQMIRERAERDRQERERVRRVQEQRSRDNVFNRVEEGRKERERVRRVQEQRSRDNVFNRVEEGRKERQSSERGRVSKQGREDDGSRGKGRSKGDDKDGRDDRDRKKR